MRVLVCGVVPVDGTDRRGPAVVRMLGLPGKGAHRSTLPPYKVAKNYLRRHSPNTTARLSAVQHVITKLTLARLRPFNASLPPWDGLVFGGGVAQNSVLPVALAEALGLPLWRPDHPSDSTLSAGALWAAAPPHGRPTVRFLPRAAPSAGPHERICTGHKLRLRLHEGSTATASLIQGDVRKGSSVKGLVTCRPHRHSQEPPTVLLPAAELCNWFHCKVPLLSSAPAFLLEARGALRRRFNLSFATVALVEGGLDPTIDVLLEGLQGCAVPMLFIVASNTRGHHGIERGPMLRC